MSKNRAATLWIVNVIMAVMVFVLSLTGLINWWIIPRGYAIRGSFLVTLRHFLLGIHQWTALLFIAMLVLHLYLHWNYVITNLKKYNLLKK